MNEFLLATLKYDIMKATITVAAPMTQLTPLRHSTVDKSGHHLGAG